MIASVHIADLGPRRAIAALRKTPKPAVTHGLRSADLALAAPLSGSALPAPDFGRLALVAFWDGDEAVDQFLAAHPLATALAEGWHVRLEPLRAFGTWPGLPDDVRRERSVEHVGPAAVLTLGRLRITQARRFLKSSAAAAGAAAASPGIIWGTAMARPPFLATCSLWESSEALTAYAYGERPAHPDAIAAGRAKPFHKREAFIRFRPYGSTGSLAGKNALPETWSVTP